MSASQVTMSVGQGQAYCDVPCVNTHKGSQVTCEVLKTDVKGADWCAEGFAGHAGRASHCSSIRGDGKHTTALTCSHDMP